MFRYKKAFITFIVSVLFFAQASNVSAVSLYFDKVNAEADDVIEYDLKIGSDRRECINAAEIYANFSSKYISSAQFLRGNSIFSVWIKEPVADYANKYFSLAGGLPGGYCGRLKNEPYPTNILGKIVFHINPEQKEQAEEDLGISFNIDKSRVLLSDGLDTQAEVAFFNISSNNLAQNNADLNSDGFVDLVDFSIQLYNMAT